MSMEDPEMKSQVTLRLQAHAKKWQTLRPPNFFRDHARNIDVLGSPSIPEALRLVPVWKWRGIDQNQLGPSVSPRIQRAFATPNCWVLIDGRKRYTPLFSGVYWNFQSGFVRGRGTESSDPPAPSKRLWGANCRRRGYQCHHQQGPKPRSLQSVERQEPGTEERSS